MGELQMDAIDRNLEGGKGGPMKEQDSQEVVLDFSKVYPEGLGEQDREAWEKEMEEGGSTVKVGEKRRFGPRGRTKKDK